MTTGDPRASDVIDVELLSRWAEGSRAAGNELVERHFASVHRFFRTKVGTDLDDVVQQTFLACLEASKRYRQKSSFKTFLFGIARNQLYTHYRQVKRRNTIDFSVSSASDLSPSPTSALAAREHEQLFLQALQRIPLEAQLIVELVFWEEMDGETIAEVLDVPTNTAYSRVRRAKAQFRDQFLELAKSPSAFRMSFEALDMWAAEIRDRMPVRACTEDHEPFACAAVVVDQPSQQ